MSRLFGSLNPVFEPLRLKFLLAQPVTDGPHETPEFLSEGVPFLSVDGIQNGELVLDSCRFVSAEAHAEYRRKTAPQRNDILMGKAASTGKIARVKTDLEFSIWSPLALIRPSSQKLDSAFCEYALKSSHAQYQIDLLCNANTQKNIGMADIGELIIPLPNLSVQRTIADFLDLKTATIDMLIAQKERLLELLVEKRQAVITQAVTKGLDPSVPMKESGVIGIGKVPRHWSVLALKFLLSGPIEYGANEAAGFDEPSWPRFIRITDIAEDGCLRDDTFRSLPPNVARDYLLRDNDILLARSGATVGKSFIYRSSLGPACFAGYLVRVRLSALLRPDFLSLYLQSSAFWSFIGMTSIQATIQNVGADRYAALPIPTPPTRMEQEEIATHLERSTALLGENVRLTLASITRLREYRQALITAAVTGKIDVTQNAKEAA